MLDTNILIYMMKNQYAGVAERVNALVVDDTLSMSFITWAKLLKGAERSHRKAETLRRLDGLARQVSVLYPNGSAICQHYARHFTRLKDAGTPIGATDLWVACHALAVNATLVTHNTREFERVDGLHIDDWTLQR